ncbi:MAG: prepilin peptidase [Lachnospiraceae bacterium]|nr:prepilin peptidase [Lachnospiraceae bacterium]
MYQKLLTFSTFAVCSYTDIRYRRIYGWSLILYCFMAIVGHVFDKRAGAADLAAGLLPGIICIVISWISRQSIGYGDSILVTICGISLGLMDCLQLLFTAFFLSGLYGLILIVVLKKSRKYDMPFVPFLFLGVLLLGG